MKAKRAPHLQRACSNQTIISSLKATKMISSKCVLPAELISTILEILPIPDLMRFARASKRMQEMVYEDSRWVQRLRAMGAWNEGEARKRIKKYLELPKGMRPIIDKEEAKRVGIGVDAGQISNPRITRTALFNADMRGNNEDSEDEQFKFVVNSPNHDISTIRFEILTEKNTALAQVLPWLDANLDPEIRLNVFLHVNSNRGLARFEYAKIYAALSRFYNELVMAESLTNLDIFRIYSNPESQAQILAHLQRFSKSDWGMGWKQREEKLLRVVENVEQKFLREFTHGYMVGDVDGKMRRYAQSLTVLNGGNAAIEKFVQNNLVFSNTDIIGSPMDCINLASVGSIYLVPFQELLEKFGRILNEQADIIDRVFLPGVDIFLILLDKFVDKILAKYILPLLYEVHKRDTDSYVKALPSLLEQSVRFGLSLKQTRNSSKNFPEEVKAIIVKIFESQTDCYLEQELENFKKCAEGEVSEWENKLSAYHATTESFFMGNFNRQSDKKDFLSSFKKVVMMPVNAFPLGSTFNTKPTQTQLVSNKTTLQAPISPLSSAPYSPKFTRSHLFSSTTTAPKDELAAKVALMASRLEGIRSLVSIEVALNLTHAAKESIERAALLISLSGQAGEKAREQCSIIFMQLLQILGQRHVKSGFDKAVDHLLNYKRREAMEYHQGVAPLVTFLELVNVGDLISQMIDVFYEQQLCGNKIIDRNDCFNIAVKAKNKFEKMLDERVAAGLNRGIDVLMTEVEFILATLQLPTDYNPAPTSDGNFEVGPSKAAEMVVNLVKNHMNMLVESTDKNTLDVFNQEVGLRLFSVLCRHLERQRISVDGSMRLISDMNVFFLFIKTLKNKELLEYFKALKALSQIYMISPVHAKEMAEVIADTGRFGRCFRAEEVYKFAERRADWYSVKKDVEKAMYGFGCGIM